MEHWASAAVVSVNDDGSVVLVSGVTDQGAGQHTVMAQIVAEVLGVPFEAVKVVAADTDTTPYEEGTSGSRTTLRVGVTVKLAAEDARHQLLALAAERLETKAEDLELAGGKVFPKGQPEKAVPLSTIAAASLTSRRGPIIGTSGPLREERLAQLAKLGQVVDAPPYSTHAAEVEVDPDTGQVKVLRYIAIQDVGCALNPLNIAGQIHGCVVAGMGYALSEQVIVDRGQVINPNFGDYLLPMAPETPAVDHQLVEEPSDFGPFGAKAVGEPPIVPVAATIANAVQEAVGVRVGDLPITPEKVLAAMNERNRRTH